MRVLQTDQSNNLDFMRLLLAIVVIGSHSVPLIYGSDAAEPLSKWSHGQITFGGVAVDCFFIISGFLITASAERSSSLTRYFKKRVARIYPAFTACALFTFFLVMPIASASVSGHYAAARIIDALSQTIRLRELKYTGAFNSNPFPGEINGSIWSIQYEFWCYIGIGASTLSRLLTRRRFINLFFLGALLASFVAARFSWQPRHASIMVSILGLPDFWLRLLPLYLAGVVAYLYRDRIVYTMQGFVMALLAILASNFVVGGWAIVFPIAGCYALFYLAYVPRLKLQNFGRFGDFSYGTYLYAFPIQQVLVHWRPNMTPAILFLCATPVTLLVAVASWFGVERHFLRSVHTKKPQASLAGI